MPVRTSQGVAPVLRARAGGKVTPSEVLQLQRLAGNRAVCELLQRPRRDAAQPTVVQRRLKFDSNKLPAPSEKAKRNNSTLAQISAALEAYWAVEADPGNVQEGAKRKRLVYLVKLDELSTKWLTNYEKGTSSFGLKKRKKDPAKKTAIDALQKAVQKERADEEYRLKFSVLGPGKELIESGELLEDVTYNKFAFAKADKRNKKRDFTTQLSTDERKGIEQYEKFKAMGLTVSEIGSIYAYTGHQYMFLNPAMAGSSSWLAKNMAELKQDTSAGNVAKTMKVNLEVSATLLSALKKLPPWPGGRTLYRGETMDYGTGKRVSPGFLRPFNHFVSTSLGTKAPEDQIRKYASPARPYKILYHITSAGAKGRDVQELAKSGKSEAEILFLPESIFRVTEVVVNDPSDIYKEVKVEVL